jgi:hypothetical protein
MQALEACRNFRIRVHDDLERPGRGSIHRSAKVPSIDVQDDVVRVAVAIDRIAGGVRFPGVQHRDGADGNLMMAAAIGVAAREVEAETDLHLAMRVDVGRLGARGRIVVVLDQAEPGMPGMDDRQRPGWHRYSYTAILFKTRERSSR